MSIVSFAARLVESASLNLSTPSNEQSFSEISPSAAVIEHASVRLTACKNLPSEVEKTLPPSGFGTYIRLAERITCVSYASFLN